MNKISKDISDEFYDIILNSISENDNEEDIKVCLSYILDDIEQKKQFLERFKEKIQCCSKILRDERTFVTIKNIRNVIVVGDLHGDSDSTNKYVKEIEKLFKNGQLDYVVFLGDYIDRGPSSLQVLNLVVDLKLRFPNKVTLLRGNHETQSMFLSQGKDGANHEIDCMFCLLRQI